MMRNSLTAFLVLGAGQYALAACPSTAEITIQSQSDADAFSDCTAFEGSIKIDASASGNIGLNGLTDIRGNLSGIQNSELLSLSAPLLQTIGGTLQLEGLSLLASLDIQKLSSVDSISLVDLPKLQSLSFPAGLEKVNSLRVVNTQINSMDGITASAIETIEVTHNAYLTRIGLDSVITINSTASIGYNDQSLGLLFPNMVAVGNLSVYNISSLGLPSLQNITASMHISGSSASEIKISTLSAIENDLLVDNCGEMADLLFPSLKMVGGTLDVTDNSKLATIVLDDLQRIGGAVDISGVFTNLSMSSLTDVKGGFSAQSSQNFDCEPFAKARTSGIIKGTYLCSSNSPIASATPTNTADPNDPAASSSAASSSPSTGKSKSGVSGGVIGGIVAGIVVILVLAIMLIIRYRQSRSKGDIRKEEDTDAVLHPPPGAYAGNAELVGSTPSFQMAELSGDYKHTLQRDQAKEVAVPVHHYAPEQYQGSPTDGPHYPFISPISSRSGTFGTNFPSHSRTEISELEGSSISELNGTPVTPTPPVDLK